MQDTTGSVSPLHTLLLFYTDFGNLSDRPKRLGSPLVFWTHLMTVQKS